MIDGTKWILGAAMGVALFACTEDDATVAPTPPAPDGGTKTVTPPAKNDGGKDIEADASDGGRPPRTAPVFLAADAYAAFIDVDEAFPFGVTQVHAADSTIVGSHWGAHDGPMTTTNLYGTTGASPTVLRWTLGATPTAPATKTELAIAKAPDLPAQFFYGADGMIDVPFGALLTYSTPAAPFGGEALLYDADYTTVRGRAKVNGFYSGVGLRGAPGDVVVYSGLSSFATTASNESDNGLFVAPLCNAALAGGAACAKSHQLFGWAGNSGPVVSDAHGNVFVAASVAGGDTSDAVYGLAHAQAFSADALTPAALAAIDSVGTASLAAIAPENGGKGYVVGLGFAEAAPVYAAPYEESANALTAAGTVVTKAISRANGIEAVYLFTDAEGDLWLAVTKGDAGAYIELRRKP